LKIKTGVLLVLILLILGGPLFAAHIYGRFYDRYDYAPEVRLIEPRGGVVDVSGRPYLEFKWSPFEGDRMQRDHYDFRIYAGYQTLESTLIFKTRIPPDIYSIRVRADLFRDGQVYTWTMRQVYTGSVKSRRSYSSFRAINR
jgi:hypothetical protein